MWDDPSLAKFDRVFVSNDWEKRLAMATLGFVHRSTSDHTPILLETDKTEVGFNGCFILNNGGWNMPSWQN